MFRTNATQPDAWWRRVYLHALLFSVYLTLHVLKLFSRDFAKRIAEKNLSAQIVVRSIGLGRTFFFKDGKLRSMFGPNSDADVTLEFADCFIAVRLLTPPINFQHQIDAQKNFQLKLLGPDELTYHFTQIMIATRRIGWKFGTKLSNGVMRYATNTNGGPLFVHVKDDEIVSDSDKSIIKRIADSWNIPCPF